LVLLVQQDVELSDVFGELRRRRWLIIGQDKRDLRLGAEVPFLCFRPKL
jgi:hypothetical protein